MKEVAKPLVQLTASEVVEKILEAKSKDPHNHTKIQRLQQLLDKLTKN